MLINAKVINNIPYCNCKESELSGIRDYKEIQMNGKKLTMFIKRCLSCGCDVRYACDVNIEESVRYEIGNDIEEVKEESAIDE